jgi:uncharacterized membrane protein (TIGR02234 family)
MTPDGTTPKPGAPDGASAAGASPGPGSGSGEVSLLGRLTARRVVVGVALAGAVLALFAGTRTWATAAVPDLPAADVGVSGRQAAPVVVAVALAAAAAVVVAATSGRVVRLVAAAALVAGGLGIAAASLTVAADPRGAVRPAVTAATGVTDPTRAGDARTTFWPYPAALGGVLIAVAGLGGLAGGRSWPAPGRRFEVGDAPPAASSADAAARRAGDDVATWDALSRGEDPT